MIASLARQASWFRGNGSFKYGTRRSGRNGASGSLLPEFLAVEAGCPVKDTEDVILDNQKIFVLDGSSFFKDGPDFYLGAVLCFH